MEDFTLPNIGARFKIGVLYTHSSKMPSPFPNFLITLKNQKNQKIGKNEGGKGTTCSLSD
jgi:hypothetical protein